LWWLNFLLGRLIPFNRPHGIKVIKISKTEIQTKIPYKKRNLNHIKGIHACGLATAAEFASGLLLLYNLGFKEYRLIMKSIHVDYNYQAKKEAIATFTLPSEQLQSEMLSPLKEDGVVEKHCRIEVKDIEGNILCEAQTNWQIKSWGKVRTKV
jgi:acyl-coenzyme A thioesterase PaaI-like protein